jgi:cAMP phosphodiesterase
MHSAPIYFLNLTYEVKKYIKKRGEIILSTVFTTKKSREVCIGKTIDILNNKYWNANLMSRLTRDNQGKYGCEINIVSFDVISELGTTTKRFKEREFPA